MYEHLFTKYKEIRKFQDQKKKHGINTRYKIKYEKPRDIAIQVAVREDLFDDFKELSTAVYDCNKRAAVIHDVVLSSPDKTNELENGGLGEYKKFTLRADSDFAKILKRKLKESQVSSTTPMYWLNAQLEDFMKEARERNFLGLYVG